jgi:hypothetical protein
MTQGDGVMVSYRMRVGMMSRNETSPLTYFDEKISG